MIYEPVSRCAPDTYRPPKDRYGNADLIGCRDRKKWHIDRNVVGPATDCHCGHFEQVSTGAGRLIVARVAAAQILETYEQREQAKDSDVAFGNHQRQQRTEQTGDNQYTGP